MGGSSIGTLILIMFSLFSLNKFVHKALEQIVKKCEKMLPENPDGDIKQIIDSCKSSVVTELDKVETVRNQQNHPSLSEEDISK